MGVAPTEVLLSPGRRALSIACRQGSPAPHTFRLHTTGVRSPDRGGPAPRPMTNAAAIIGVDPAEVAAEAGLRYVSDATPGIRRLKRGAGFRYVGPDGETVRSPAQRDRIRALAIPPAWTDVWICPLANGHLQATGRDAGPQAVPLPRAVARGPGRRQVRPPRDFGRALPRSARAVDADCAGRASPATRCSPWSCGCSTRPSSGSATTSTPGTNESYGLTTLGTEHVEIDGREVSFASSARAGSSTRSASATAGWRGSSSAARTSRPGALPVPTPTDGRSTSVRAT